MEFVNPAKIKQNLQVAVNQFKSKCSTNHGKDLLCASSCSNNLLEINPSNALKQKVLILPFAGVIEIQKYVCVNIRFILYVKAANAS